jgi:hypothetical protein
VGELAAQGGAAAVDAGADGAELHAQDVRDLLVAEPLDVTQDDRDPEVHREAGQRRLDVVVELLRDGGRLGGADPAGQPVVAVLGQGVETDALAATGLVEEEVGGDAVQPALEVPGV